MAFFSDALIAQLRVNELYFTLEKASVAVLGANAHFATWLHR